MFENKRIFNFQRLDLIKSIGWFWGIMLLVNIFFYIMNLRYYPSMSIGLSNGFNGTTMLSVAGFNLMPIIIYFISHSFETHYESFPISISFSTTRRDYYKSVILSNITVAISFALILTILLKVDPLIIRAIGRIPMMDFGIFNTSIDSIIYIIFSLVLSFSTVQSIINLVVVLSYKFGYKIWVCFGVGVFILTAIFGNKSSLWSMFDELFTTRVSTLHLITLGGIIISSYLLGYVIIINTNIKNKIS